ncbi:MAG: GNAT family N-acetyltransferase, partial [Phycisphaerales bacterium]|nr:GNAT family N-acetyltransferase [Phycisphaerales bacterium]
ERKLSEVITETDRLVLRAPVLEDIDPLALMWSDPETMKYIGKTGQGWTREMVAERIERAIRFCKERGMTFWTVVEKDSNQIIGQGGLVPIEFNGPEIELGYRLGIAHWGKGFATEIAGASAAYGFETLDFNRLIAVCYAENLGSRKVLKKVGFKELGESDLYYDTTTVLHELIREHI